MRVLRVFLVALLVAAGVSWSAPAEAHQRTMRTRNIYIRVVSFPTDTRAVITVESQRKRTREIACWSYTDEGGGVAAKMFRPGQQRTMRLRTPGQELRFSCIVT